ncbi:MAG: nucleotidyltransferase domain-containing protein [Candidatus Bathyarchaeia archaeon]
MLRRLLVLPDLYLRDLPEGVRRALKIFLESIVRELGDVEVYLFGSYARGIWWRIAI